MNTSNKKTDNQKKENPDYTENKIKIDDIKEIFSESSQR